jgi:hypothetical protein
MSWAPGTKRQSRIGSLGQLRREPPGSICSRAKPSFAPASLALNLFARSLLLCIRTCLRNRAEPATSKILPFALANVPIQSRSDLHMDQESLPYLAAPSSSELVAPGHCLHFVAFPFGSSRHNYSSAFVRIEACLHQDHIFRCRPRQATSVLHEQFAVPLDLIRCFPFNGLRRPLCTTLLLPGQVRLQPPHCNFSRIARDLPAHHRPARRAATPPLPAAEPVFAPPCRITNALVHAFQRCSRHLGLLPPRPSHSRARANRASSALSAPPRTCFSIHASASPAFAPIRATPEPTRCFHCAALQLLFAQRPRASAVCSPEAVGFAPALGSRASPARTQLPCTSSPVAPARSAFAPLLHPCTAGPTSMPASTPSTSHSRSA